jgi:hypothetical protein
MSIKASLEKDIQRQVLDYLALVGAWPVRINSGAMQGTHAGKKWFMRMNSQPGCPDVLCCLGGRFVGIEVKRGGGIATDKQLSALDAIRRAGGVAFVATSVADVERALKAEGLV